MKLSKRLTALFAAVLMAVSVLSSTTTAFATSKTGSFYCGSYKVSCSLVSANKYSGIAITSTDVNFNTLCATIFGTKVDKNGDNPKYIGSSGTPKYNATYVSEGIPVLSSTGGYYYAKMATAHIGIKNGKENSLALNVSY